MTVRDNATTKTIVVLLGILGSLVQPVQAQSGRTEVSHRVALRVSAITAMALNDDSPVELSVTQESAVGYRTLRYSTINKQDATQNIAVQWRQTDSAPLGTALRVAAKVPDKFGMACPEVTVGDSPQSLISWIPSCTTDAASGGVALQYRLNVIDASKISSGARMDVSLIFTISDK